MITILGNERRNLNWKRQPSDLRDLPLVRTAMAPRETLPSHASTTGLAAPAVRDQGTLGSCTQNAGAAAMAYVFMRATQQPDPMFSRLYGYWYTRHLEGVAPTNDSGCNVRDVFKAYRRWGLCFERTWPYLIDRFHVQPPVHADEEAKQHQALRFYTCPSLLTLKHSIHDGWPVIFGFDCFESIDSPAVERTGKIPSPQVREASLGGHCMYADGYDDATQLVTGLNSWGTTWGDRGRFYLPYDYWYNGFASDGMTLRAVEV